MKTPKETIPRKYQPSNGTEGMIFMEMHCENCIHDHAPTEKDCEIIVLSMNLDINDKEYPSEWVYDTNDKPTCTKFKRWNWGNGNDGYNFPPEPPYEPQDPKQLTIFTIDDFIDTDPNQIDLLEMIKEVEQEKN